MTILAGNYATLQAAADAAVACSDELYLSAWYAINAPLVVSGPLVMRGLSEHAAGIILSDPTQDGIQVAGNAPVHFEKFAIKPASGIQTAGAMIRVSPPTGENDESTFERLRLSNCNEGLTFERAAYWHVSRCEINGFGYAGIRVRNLNNADAGDSTITDSLIIKGTYGGACVYQESSGGLRLVGNKLLFGDYGYRLNVAAGSTSADSILTGNSIEQQRLAGISMGAQSGTSVWYNGVITGNQLENSNTAIQITTPGGNWLRNLTVSGNSIVIPGTGGLGIDIAGTDCLYVGGNAIRCLGGTSYGVVIRAGAGPGVVDHSAISGLTVPVSNSGTGVTVT